MNNPLIKGCVSIQTQSKTIKAKISNDINPEFFVPKKRINCINEITKYVNSINKKVKPKRGEHAKNQKGFFSISQKDFKEIGDIGLRFPVEIILKAIEKVNKTYVQKGLKVDNLVALIRNIIRSYTEFASTEKEAFI